VVDAIRRVGAIDLPRGKRRKKLIEFSNSIK
jgi:hypothetical protein